MPRKANLDFLKIIHTCPICQKSCRGNGFTNHLKACKKRQKRIEEILKQKEKEPKKKCKDCLLWKPISDFSRSKDYRDGHITRCKLCFKIYDIDRRQRQAKGETYKPKPIHQRFWDYVDKTGDCWIWLAARTECNYGVIRHKGRSEKAHRVAWMLVKGEIPKGLCVCHKCDNPPCVNPDHLFLGTMADNDHDKVRKGRQPRGEKIKQSKLTEEKVKKIRKEYDPDKNTYKDMALKYGVKSTTIASVVQKRTWKHVQ